MAYLKLANQITASGEFVIEYVNCNSADVYGIFYVLMLRVYFFSKAAYSVQMVTVYSF